MTVRMSIYEFIALYKALKDMSDEDKTNFLECDNVVINIKSDEKSIKINIQAFEKNFND